MFRAFQRHLTAYIFDIGQSMGLVVLGIQFDKCKSRWVKLFILQEEKIISAHMSSPGSGFPYTCSGSHP